VFEFVSTSIGAQGTVCAGGRYDKLIEQLGGNPLPAVGFAGGLERLLMVMQSSGVQIPQPKTVTVYLAGMDEPCREKAFALCIALRNAGVIAETDHMARSVKAQFKYADKLGAKFVAVLGGNELAEGVLSVKNMQTGESERVTFENAVAYFSNK
jgi:histidyl-tRNA synthetase